MAGWWLMVRGGGNLVGRRRSDGFVGKLWKRQRGVGFMSLIVEGLTS